MTNENEAPQDSTDTLVTDEQYTPEVQSETPVPAQPSQPEDLIDPNLYGDFRVPITANGQETYVSLRDMTSGYMMQSDYTRKTQALAVERERLTQAERLMEAMTTDPQGTLDKLQEAYRAQGGYVDEDGYGEELTPEEQRLAELESWKSTQQERELDSFISGEVAALKSSYGEFDEGRLFDYMIQNGIKDFNVAYGAMAFSNQQRQAQADRQAQGAKQQLPPVAGGRGVAAGSVVASGGSGKVESMHDAAMAALAELNLI